jgi:hypothetical protein
MLGHKGEEVTGKLGELHHCELYDLHLQHILQTYYVINEEYNEREM